MDIDPGQVARMVAGFRLLSALDVLYARLGIPPQAQDHFLVRRRVAALFDLVVPGDPNAGILLPHEPADIERWAVTGFIEAQWPDLDPGEAGGYDKVRSALRATLGFVEPPPPPWALPGSYLFFWDLGPRGVNLRVETIADGVATFGAWPGGGVLFARAVPVGLLYRLDAHEGCVAGLPCEGCGERMAWDGCHHAPCVRAKVHLWDRVVDDAGVASAHLWWCRLTHRERGCTCAEHETKVPHWNGTREGLSVEALAELELGGPTQTGDELAGAPALQA